jgi:hypothetical protein
MTELKAGTRLRSAVCATEVMVIAAGDAELALTCGGTAMIGITEAPAEGGTIDPDHADGTLLGKRYVDEEDSLELLCTKPGDGSLAVEAGPLVLKEAKALPSSD